MMDQRLRGAQLVEGPQLAKMMTARRDTSPYELAGVPLRRGAENLHTLIAGAQGTGKSQQFFRLMRQVRERGRRAFVYDPTGEFAAAFYRDGRDVILNPLDRRCPHWTIWNEIERDYHFDNMANGLIPDPAQADPFWAQAGRMVLKDVYRVLGNEGRRTNANLYNAVARSNLDALHALLAGTAGATYVDPVTERTGMSLKMTVQNQLESFRFLDDTGPSFSLRDWVRNEESDSWVFITARESQRDAMKPLLSLWITTIIMAILDLQPVHRERIWGFLDELPTLQKMDILKLALTNTRKYGLCLVLGVQDFTQLYETNGQYLASTIVNGCQTKLLLRVTDGVAAKKLADLMGQVEMNEKEETLSYGLSSERDGVSVFARRNLREIVLTSQILTLPDMTGYLTIPGDYPVARVTYGFEPNPTLAPGFIEREGFGISFRPPPPSPPTPTSGGPRQSAAPDRSLPITLGPSRDVTPVQGGASIAIDERSCGLQLNDIADDRRTRRPTDGRAGQGGSGPNLARDADAPLPARSVRPSARSSKGGGGERDIADEQRLLLKPAHDAPGGEGAGLAEAGGNASAHTDERTAEGLSANPPADLKAERPGQSAD
jgi:type IV conjugative transfer system coupling protein TraD